VGATEIDGGERLLPRFCTERAEDEYFGAERAGGCGGCAAGPVGSGPAAPAEIPTAAG